MNIDPKTGKPYINNYKQMYGNLFINQTHKHIQLDRYYDLVGKLEGKTKTMYAMILHSHIAQTICNRVPGIQFNIFMYIDTKKGTIANAKDMKAWMLKTGWMNCNGAHLLKIASPSTWHIVYKTMLNIGLLEENAGILRCSIPIDGRFLPIPYAYVAFLSRLKRDGQLNTSISKALSSVPDKMRSSLDELPKEEIIDEIIRLKTKGLVSGRKSEVYRMLYEEISAKYPHKWNDENNKNFNNRENFLENILEKGIGNLLNENGSSKLNEYPGDNTAEQIADNIPNKIQSDIEKREEYKERKKKEQTLKTDEFADYEIEKSPRGRPVGQNNKQSNKSDLETNLFFADDVTANDSKKARKANKVSEDELKSLEKEYVPDLPDANIDMFGIEQEEIDPDVIDIPDIINITESIKVNNNDGFWSVK